jgi:GWxTD domain-containing protein
MKIKVSIVVVACLFACFSCNTAKPQKQKHDREREQDKTYSKEENDLQVAMFLYHTDSINSQLYYTLNNSQLIYKRTDSSQAFTASVKVFYKMLPYADSKAFFDSATVYINDKSTTQPQAKNLTGYISLKINVAQTSYIEVYVNDVNGKRHHTHFIKFEKKSPYTQQNYILLGDAGRIYFSNKIEKGNTVTINNARVSFAKARVDFFATDYSLPPPPFSQREPVPYPSIPDSTFYATSYDGHSFSLQVAKQGVYFIRLDSTVKTEGCMIMGVEQNFPKVLSHNQMIAATRFIMNKDEYQKMATAIDKQAAIDHFWLSLAGNQERARELIKRYYNRIQDANTFFTSHIEGWKTDMGMVYLIFGPPNKTYKTLQLETWVYGKEGTPNAVTFRFEKINNPFSDTNFKLVRSVTFKDPWYMAVNNWRDGHVYLDAK